MRTAPFRSKSARLLIPLMLVLFVGVFWIREWRSEPSQAGEPMAQVTNADAAQQVTDHSPLSDVAMDERGRVGDSSVPMPELTRTDTPASGKGEGGSQKFAASADDARAVSDDDVAWMIHDAGMPRAFVLALDEAWVRTPDGKGESVSIDAGDAEELEQRILETAERLSLPVMAVLFEDGLERSDMTRRIVTPAVTVKTNGAGNPAEIASAAGAASWEAPSYAPDHLVLQIPGVLAPLRAAAALASVDGVEFAEPQLARLQSKRAMPNDSLINQQWHHKFNNQTGAVSGTDLNIETVWAYPTVGAGFRGRGVRIGIVDDGLQTAHPDLTTNVDTVNDKDWNGNDNDPNPGSVDDHGTACAGDAAARGNNSMGGSGSAPEATLVGMRLIGGTSTDSMEAEAMNYLPQLIQIKSNSWGPSDTGTVLEAPGSLTRAALKTAAETGRGGNGTIFTWAGGNGLGSNDNSNYDGYANSIYTIAVGAFDSQSRQAYYSEPGANLVIVSPSGGTSPALGKTTTDRTGSAGYSSGDYTNSFSGTSSATPTAAGVIALMLEANPNLGWRDVQEILLRSAKKVNPGDSDWTTNAAGIQHNHKFGSGLIDSAAAVTMAQGWTNLSGQLKHTIAQTGLSIAIPDQNTSGITRQFVVSPADNLRTEHVTVTVNINHTARGNMAITLTSPSGTASRLTEVHSDSGDNFSNWTLMSVRNWGEDAAGTWTLNISDRSATGNSTGGTLTAATLDIFGASAVPVNPPPVVALTSPAAGAVFSPGATVALAASATDRDVNGATSSVQQVEFLVNGQPIHTDTTAPYSFAWQPTVGTYSIAARATDTEGASATSIAVSIEVRNQIPLVTAATLSVGAEAFSDELVSVLEPAASDPEGAVLSFTYQWQSSVTGSAWSDAAGFQSPTLPASPDLAAKLWRCLVRANDGFSLSEPFATATVSIRNRPVTSATVGTPYTYQPGLYVPTVGADFQRQAIIQEFSQGSNSGEWVEILMLKDGSLALYDIEDSSGNYLLLLDDPVWDDIPAGTLIVIFNGAIIDPLLPAQDTNPHDDGRMVLSSYNDAYFDFLTDWPALGNSGDGILLNDADNVAVSQVGYGNNLSIPPNIGTVNSGRAAYYAGDSEEGVTVPGNWRTTTASTARAMRIQRAPGDLFFSEYVEGTSNNKAVEIYNPSNVAVDLSAAGYQVLNYANGAATPNGTITLTGTIAAGGVYVVANSSASTAITAQFKSSLLSFNGDDAVALRKGGASGTLVDVIGQIGLDPGTAWSANGVSTFDTTLRRKSTIAQGDTNGSDAFNPSIEWDAFPVDTFTGLGSHTGPASGPTMSLTLSPSSIAENAGTGASTGTLTLSAATTQALVVNLVSSDTSEAVVPASVTIALGASSATFVIDAIDDADSDGTQSVSITAVAAGYADAVAMLNVTDNEPSIEGVTPGTPNNAANTTFIQNIRSGVFGQPPLYALDPATQLPPGLAFDTVTGVLSGTPTTAGSYPIVIRRSNTFGETASQSFTLTVAAGSGPVPASVTANAASKVYSDADPALTYTVSGLEPGDSLTGSLQREVGENAGTYAITQGTLDGGSKYAITFTGASFSITPKALGANDITLVRGSDGSFTASAAGMSGFSFSYIGRNGTSYGPSDDAPTADGEYMVTATVNDPNFTGTKSEDFTIGGEPVEIAPFKVTSITMSGALCTLAWESQAGLDYTIEATTDPANPQSWAPVASGIAGSANFTSTTLDLSTTPHAASRSLFLRIKASR